LRNGILNLEPGKFGLSPQNGTPAVWGLLMEMGFPQAAVTLVVLAEGTTSLYYGSGGGFLGAGTQPAVAEASRACLAQALVDLPGFQAAQGFPLPQVEQVNFILLTFEGALAVTADWNSLASGGHRLSRLWECGQEVITQLWLLQEQA
jgi:hypothetical protein